MKKKIVPASQKISCLLARISSFFENCLFLIPITFSTSSKIALTKKILFPLGRKSFSNSWIKDFEKSVTTIWKSCFYFKKSLKKMVFNGSSSKIDFYLISIIASTSRKLAEKYASVGSILWKKKKKWFPLAGKFVSPSTNKLTLAWVFFKKLDSS